MSGFRIIFVLDILNGIVVHAVKGERAKYRPVEGSMICNSSDPIEMISAIHPPEVYIADLDHLQHMGDNFGLIKEISGRTKTMVDIGVRNLEDVRKCANIADTVIVGTETASLEVIEKAATRFPGRINLSIDMKNGIVLTEDPKMKAHPQELVRKLNDFDLKDIIILDLGRVGTSAGINRDLLKTMVETSTHNIIAGGGIRDLNDIDVLKELGIGGALVATAVHNGKIPIFY